MAEGGRLDGWKAIADYLARDERTVQRWHRGRAMPVHRVPGGRRGAVFAYRGELDGWLREAASAEEPVGSTRHAKSQPDFYSSGDAFNDATQDSGPDAGALASSSDQIPSKNQSASPTGSVSTTAIHAGSRRHGHWLLWVAAVAGLALGASALYWSVWAGSPRPVDRIELRADALVALDGYGRSLWSFDVAPQVTSESTAAGVLRPTLTDVLRIDVDGDNEREVVAFLTYVTGSGSRFQYEQIHLFSPSGRLLWTFKPDADLSFAGRHFSGPWRVRSWLASLEPSPGIWVSFIDDVWWPSYVVRLNAKGDAILRFVNSGHVEVLGRVQGLDGPYLLAGGVNNEFRSAALAVLRENGTATRSPQRLGSPFECGDKCPQRDARRYFLFPKSEVSAAFGQPYNFVDIIEATSTDGRIEISVREVPRPTNARSLYRLSTNLIPESVAMSDVYWETHTSLFRAGKLDHPAESCPERLHGVMVRMWDPDAGWKDIAVPPTFPPVGASGL